MKRKKQSLISTGFPCLKIHDPIPYLHRFVVSLIHYLPFCSLMNPSILFTLKMLILFLLFQKFCLSSIHLMFYLISYGSSLLPTDIGFSFLYLGHCFRVLSH